MKGLAILRFNPDARFCGAKPENAGSAIEFGFGFQHVAARCATRVDEPAATLCSNDRRDVEAAVGALPDREFLSILRVARDIVSIEGESAMRSQKRPGAYR